MAEQSRRTFLAQCGQAGLGAGLAGMLAACVTRRIAPPRDEEARSAAGPLERELHVYIWSDYVAHDTVSNFERETGVRVTYDTYESNEEMIAKLVGGGSGYDVICPTNYLVPVLRDGGLLQPLDHAVLTNWGNLDPYFVNHGRDPGGRYSMPYQWGMTGVAYRDDLIAERPTSWSVFTNPALRLRMTMLDNERDVLGSLLIWRGHSYNSVVRSELERARDDAIAIKPNLRAYVSSPVKAQLISGDVALAQLWSSDATMAQLEEPRVVFTIPDEGANVYSDCLAILRGAPNRRAAHAWLNYVLRPEVVAAISNEAGGGSPNRASQPLLRRPSPPPGPALLKRLEFARDLGPANDLADRLWTEVLAA